MIWHTVLAVSTKKFPNMCEWFSATLQLVCRPFSICQSNNLFHDGTKSNLCTGCHWNVFRSLACRTLTIVSYFWTGHCKGMLIILQATDWQGGKEFLNPRKDNQVAVWGYRQSLWAYRGVVWAYRWKSVSMVGMFWKDSAKKNLVWRLSVFFPSRGRFASCGS